MVSSSFSHWLTLDRCQIPKVASNTSLSFWIIIQSTKPVPTNRVIATNFASIFFDWWVLSCGIPTSSFTNNETWIVAKIFKTMYRFTKFRHLTWAACLKQANSQANWYERDDRLAIEPLLSEVLMRQAHLYPTVHFCRQYASSPMNLYQALQPYTVSFPTEFDMVWPCYSQVHNIEPCSSETPVFALGSDNRSPVHKRIMATQDWYKPDYDRSVRTVRSFEPGTFTFFDCPPRTTSAVGCMTMELSSTLLNIPVELFQVTAAHGNTIKVD